MNALFIILLILISLISPFPLYASHLELDSCIEVSHCAREELKVNNIDKPFDYIKKIIEKTPRTKIVYLNGDYLHAEVTSKWMKYVDDLEVSYIPKSNILIIRSESRVGESDLGVNLKRVDLIKSELFHKNF